MMSVTDGDRDVLNNLSPNSSFDEYNLLSHEEVEANLLSLLEDDELQETSASETYLPSNCTPPKSDKQATDTNEETCGNTSEQKGNDTENTSVDDFIHEDDIKMEFTCESEEMIGGECFLDEKKKDDNNGCGPVQIEIRSTSKDDLSNSLIDTNDLVSSLMLDIHSEDEIRSNFEENHELFSIMSDHNYTSQERTTPSTNLRQFLTNYITNEKNALTNQIVSDYIEKTIEQLDSFKIELEFPTVKFPSSDSSNLLEADETQKISESDGNENVSDDAVHEAQKMDTSDTIETISKTANVETEKKRDTDAMEKISDIASGDIGTENSKNQEVDFSTFNVPSPSSPQENCSEPLEYNEFDEAFDLNCNKNGDENGKVEKLLVFAKQLEEDCTMFGSSTSDIENKLQKYLNDRLVVFKNIVNNVDPDSRVEKSVQTDKLLSRRRLKKLNTANKEMLLNTSDSDSSDDEFDNSIKSQPLAYRKSINVTSEENMQKIEYEDDLHLYKYTHSVIFETDISPNYVSQKKKNVCQNDTDESESDRRSQKVAKSDTAPAPQLLQNESDKENVSTKSLERTNSSKCKDESDKEIDRLINLNGLSKRPNNSIIKSSESSEKPKGTNQNTKKEKKCTNLEGEDIQQESNSDNTMSGEEEEITEKQYLARLNENIKRGLLTDSSSESSISDEEDTEESLSNNERSNSPLVERFLKKFDANETDENTTEVSESGEVPPSCDISGTQKSPLNSDCEVLENNQNHNKNIKPKSLEKMLSDVEKRKKMNKLCGDLISLSSESESSDVEAVEDAKSRVIKPMLRPDQLASETRKAQREEADRIRRLEKKQKMLAKALKENPDAQKSSALILDYNEETKAFIKVLPDIVKHLKPHQFDGVKFMYDSCYGGLESLKKHPGSGCILAHCMGLGKTLQLIALLHTVISYKELKTSKVLILCPKSTVMNWADEIKRWLGPQAPKYYTFSDTSDINDKLKTLQDWTSVSSKSAGILLIGYEAFRTLVFYHSYKNRGIPPSRLESIRTDVEKYLLNPGADLVVCDEGHIIKNSKSAISVAVSQIMTPKRIILTGTPIQNNLKEYYSMVNFIKPLFLGTEKEFANLYANPIKNGQHKDSSKRDIKVMKQRSFVLHKKLSKFVQRKEAELLKTFLPKKYEYVLFIPMTTVQNNLYEHILNNICKRGENRGKSLITDYTCLRKIWTHPKVLEDAWKNANNQKLKKDLRKNQVHSDDELPDDVYDSQTGVMSVTNDWWRSLLSDKDLETLLPSNKLRTMFEILRMCEEKGEKCLIFSAFVAVLNVVEYFFKKINSLDAETTNGLNISESQQVRNTWVLGKDYYRLDGKTPKVIRHEMVESFNNVLNKRARVFLISSRAGGQGINLIGANRVIILDTSWNPSNDQQNIFRIFRLGQKKNCYIYRLLAMGTMEEKVYSRSVTKQAMSFRVVDEQQIDRHYNMAELGELYTLTIPNYEERQLSECPQDSILASLLYKYPHLVFKFHEHDSLLENKVEQELSEQEKADAWAAYERDLQLNSENPSISATDEQQNNIAASKFPNYMAPPTPGFDMSSFFNYGNFANQSTYSPFLQPLLPQCNYPTVSPSYLEIYKRLAQNAFPFPDMSASLAGSGFHPPFAHNSSKSIPANSPLIPEINSKAINSNPLSALGDLSMYGIGPPGKNLSPNINAQNLSQRQHASSPYSAPPTSILPYDQYRQTLEESIKSLTEYRKDNRMNMLNVNNSKTSANLNQFQHPFFPSPLALHTVPENHLNSPINMPSPKNLDQQSSHQTDKSYMQKSGENMHFNVNNKNETTSISKVKSPTNTSNSSVCSTAQQNISKRPFTSDVISITNATNRYEDSSGSSRGSINSQSNNVDNGANINLLYANRNLSSKLKNEHLKTSNEMQIIPKSGTLGSENAAKQFNEISPSISLTALNSINGKSLNPNKSQAQSTNSRNKVNYTSTKTSTVTDGASSSNALKKLTENAQKSISPVCVTPTSFSSKYSAANVTAKTGSAAMSTTQSAYRSGNLADQTFAGGAKNDMAKNSQNLISHNESKRNLSPVTARTLNSLQPTNVHSTAQQKIQSNIKKFVNSTENRSSPITTTNTQFQKQATSSTLTTPTTSPAVTKNVLNIRPADKNPTKTGVYIIETNINEKKLAIGVPTKSGGGTTVTKVPLQRKRKVGDSSMKDTTSNESKRAK